jgi:hypothetical protein
MSKKLSEFILLTITAWMLSGCHSSRDTLFKATKEHASVDNIRKAIFPLFSKYHYSPLSQGDMVVPFKEIPYEIRSLPLFSTIPKNNHSHPTGN